VIVLPKNDYNNFMHMVLVLYGLKEPKVIRDDFVVSTNLEVKKVKEFSVQKTLYKLKLSNGSEINLCEFMTLLVVIGDKVKFLTPDEIQKIIDKGEQILTPLGEQIVNVEVVENSECEMILYDVVKNDDRIRDYLVLGVTNGAIIRALNFSSLVAYLVGEVVSENMTEILPGILELEFEKVYEFIFFQTKKRYYGYLSNMKFDVKGLEIVRRDWNKAAKDVQKKIMDIIAQYELGKAIKLSEKFIREIIRKYRKREFKINEVVITKRAKALNEYKDPDRVAQAQVVKLLEENGIPAPSGTIVSYVVLSIPTDVFIKMQKTGKIIASNINKKDLRIKDRVVPMELVTDIELLKQYIDIDYVLDKQILPASLRLLEVVGVNPEIFEDYGNARITDFIKVRRVEKKKEEIKKKNKKLKQITLI